MPFSSAKQQTTIENRERVNKEHNIKRNTQSKRIIITIIKTKVSRKNKLKTQNSEQKSNTKKYKRSLKKHKRSLQKNKG